MRNVAVVDMFSMARQARRPGLIVDLPYRLRREQDPPIDDGTADSAAFEAALAAAVRCGHVEEVER